MSVSIDNDPNSPVNIAGEVLGSIGGAIILLGIVIFAINRYCKRREVERRNEIITDSYVKVQVQRKRALKANTDFRVRMDETFNPIIYDGVGDENRLEEGGHTEQNELVIPHTSRSTNPLLSHLGDDDEEMGQGKLPVVTSSKSRSISPAVPLTRQVSHEADTVQNIKLVGILKSGFLFKRSTTGRKEWLKRWFFIMSDGKVYYVHRPEYMLDKSHVDATLVANLLVSTVKQNPSNPLEFQIISPGARKGVQGGGIYELKSESESDCREWVSIMRQQIEKKLASSGAKRNDHLSKYYRAIDSMLLDRRLLAANPVCVDCGNPNPIWASLNLGIMMCIECSGVHRSLGVHVSKVRSLRLDAWTKHSVELLTAIGNSRANKVWESQNADFISQYKGTSHITPAIREKFIHDKYEKKLYLSPVLKPDQATDLLLKASKSGDIGSLYVALVNRGNINATTTVEDGLFTPLHWAVKNKHMLCVELLCIWGANVEEIDASGKSPLDLAADRHNAEIKDILEAYKPVS